MKFPNAIINKIKQLIQLNNGQRLPNTYYKMFRGQRIKHITLSVDRRTDDRKNKRFETVYYAYPEEAYKQALKRIKNNPVAPAKVITTPAIYNGRNVKMQIFKGKYTIEQVIQMAQSVSNALERRGLKGKIGITLNFENTARKGKFTDFGQRVNTYEPQHYDFIDEMPEYFDGFSLSFIYDKQGKRDKQANDVNDYNLNNLFN
jgi:hypothetical protein